MARLVVARSRSRKADSILMSFGIFDEDRRLEFLDKEDVWKLKKWNTGHRFLYQWAPTTSTTDVGLVAHP